MGPPIERIHYKTSKTRVCKGYLIQGLVNVPIKHHLPIGDINSTRYLKAMFKIPLKRDINAGNEHRNTSETKHQHLWITVSNFCPHLGHFYPMVKCGVYLPPLSGKWSVRSAYGNWERLAYGKAVQNGWGACAGISCHTFLSLQRNVCFAMFFSQVYRVIVKVRKSKFNQIFGKMVASKSISS